MWKEMKKEFANKVLKNISGNQIVDGLWKDTEGRRKIQVCKKYTYFYPVLYSYIFFS
jgi:hypothetical protein